MAGDDRVEARDRWARLRFAIVGRLLTAPPGEGALRVRLEELAAKEWLHPTKGTPVRFGVSTIERWYYAALQVRRDPVGALRRRVRKDAGQPRVMTPKLRATLRAQYDAHRTWSYQLHVDNLAVLVAQDPGLGAMPSYSTVLRYMKAHGLVRQRRKRPKGTPGAELAAARLEQREVRSYEAEYVNALWHADFHVCSRQVLTRSGEWVTPTLFGMLDDHSRLACHAQWYLVEDAENFAHGVAQGFQKRDLPAGLLTDNGGAETAGELEQGFLDLGVTHETTLPHSPYQNAKQEIFWSQVEGRLMAMLENVESLTLDLLNEATLAWIEGEYNREVHTEIGVAPIRRFLDGQRVGKTCPSSDDLRRAFRLEARRTQRKSDGTVSIEGRRFEVPSRYRHLGQVTVRYARWDLGLVHMIDERSKAILCPLYPLDKARNADGLRRALDPTPTDAAAAAAAAEAKPPGEIAPLLQKLMADYAATGLPPAYLPKPDDKDGDE